MSIDPSTVADRLALREVVDRYAQHADRRRPEALAALFTDDGVLRIVRRGSDATPVQRTGRAEIATAIAKLDRYAATFHHVGNHIVEVSGDTATGEAYCLAHHLVVGDHDSIDHVMLIRYQDRYRRTHGEWLIAERELQVEWTEERPASSADTVR